MNEQEARAKFQQADALYRAGQFAQALAVLEELDGAFPNNKNVLFPAALCLEKLGGFDRAELICDALEQQKDPRAEQLRTQIQQARIAQGEDLISLSGLADLFEPVSKRIPSAALRQPSFDWKRFAVIGAVIVAVLGVVGLGYVAYQKGWLPSRGKSMEEIQTELIDFWQKAESFRADVQVSGQMTQQGMNMGLNGGGNLEYMEQAEKPMFRLTGAFSISGMPIPMELTLETVSDGTAIFSQVGVMGQQMVIKNPMPPENSAMTASPDKVLASLKEEGVKLVRGEPLNGIEAYTFEFEPKPGSSAADALSKTGQEVGKVRVQITQDYQSAMRLEVLDKANAPLFTLMANNIQVNPALDAKDFTYKPPAGVAVMDLSDPNTLRGMMMGGIPGFGR